jgi:hypothetical protein
MDFNNLVKELGLDEAVVLCWPNVPKDWDEKISPEVLCDIFNSVQDNSKKADLKKVVVEKIFQGRQNCKFWYEFYRNISHDERNRPVEKRIVDKMTKAAKSFKDFLLVLEVLGYTQYATEFTETVLKAAKRKGRVNFSELQSLFYYISKIKGHETEKGIVAEKMISAAKTTKDWFSIYMDFDIKKYGDYREQATNKLIEMIKDLDGWLWIYHEVRNRTSLQKNRDEEAKKDPIFILACNNISEIAGNNFDHWIQVCKGVREMEAELHKTAFAKVVKLADTTEKILYLHHLNCYGGLGGDDFDYHGKMHEVIKTFEEGLKICEVVGHYERVHKKMFELADTEEKLVKLYKHSSDEALCRKISAKLRENIKV